MALTVMGILLSGKPDVSNGRIVRRPSRAACARARSIPGASAIMIRRKRGVGKPRHANLALLTARYFRARPLRFPLRDDPAPFGSGRTRRMPGGRQESRPHALAMRAADPRPGKAARRDRTRG